MNNRKRTLKRVSSVVALIVLTAVLALPLIGCGSGNGSTQASAQEVDNAILAYWKNDYVASIRRTNLSFSEEKANELEKAGPFTANYGSFNHAVIVDGQTIARYKTVLFTYEGSNITGSFVGSSYSPLFSPVPAIEYFNYDAINKYINGSWTLIIHDGETDLASITDGKVTFLVDSPPIP